MPAGPGAPTARPTSGSAGATAVMTAPAPASGQATTGQATSGQTSTDQATFGQAGTDQTSTDQTSTDQTSTDQTSTDQTTSTGQTGAQPAPDGPAAAKSPVRVNARMIAGFMAAEAWLSGDPRRTLAALGELNRPDEQNDEIRALSMLGEGEARLRLGELAAAGAPLHGALVLAQRTGMAQAQVGAAAQLSVLEAARGRLRASARLAARPW